MFFWKKVEPGVFILFKNKLMSDKLQYLFLQRIRVDLDPDPKWCIGEWQKWIQQLKKTRLISTQYKNQQFCVPLLLGNYKSQTNRPKDGDGRL